ncbi:MAG: DUF4911 domain-containing protein [Candidatus Cloacimonetes bacterium]|nr:DUF4911 domain-containing protein [Candidatus Cloacimonadota bacterium]
MKIEIVSETTLEDGVKRILLKIAPKDFIYLGYTLESLEGVCNYTTVKREQPYMQVDVSPDFIDEFEKIFACLLLEN